VSAVDREGRTTWIVDAHRDDGKGLVADERRNLNELAFESDRRDWDKRNPLPFQLHSRSLAGKR
jgi:hypothetical protein